MITVSGFKVEDWIFPGGEVGVKLTQTEDELPNTIKVVARLSSSDWVMKLLMVKDALDYTTGCHNVILHLPYLPYAQQDRICHEGESFSLNIMVNIIDSMDFYKVYLYDVHSDVALRQFVTPIEHVTAADIISNDERLSHSLKYWQTSVVAPDKGAMLRASEVADTMKLPYIQCHKIRNPETGVIESVEVLSKDIKSKDCLIVDDICLAGGTFIPVAKKLKEMGARSVNLYVTHGIFNKGVTHLLQNGIDWIYTSDSRVTDEVANHKNVTVIPLGI